MEILEKILQAVQEIQRQVRVMIVFKEREVVQLNDLAFFKKQQSFVAVKRIDSALSIAIKDINQLINELSQERRNLCK